MLIPSSYLEVVAGDFLVYVGYHRTRVKERAVYLISEVTADEKYNIKWFYFTVLMCTASHPHRVGSQGIMSGPFEEGLWRKATDKEILEALGNV